LPEDQEGEATTQCGRKPESIRVANKLNRSASGRVDSLTQEAGKRASEHSKHNIARQLRGRSSDSM